MSMKEQVMERISLLPYYQIKRVSDFLDSLSSTGKKSKRKEKLSKSQERLLDLLNHTIDTGITDLAENHHKYFRNLP
jgi:hypothetical protein